MFQKKVHPSLSMTASWQNQCGYVKICNTHDAEFSNSQGLWFLNDHYGGENHRRHPKNARASATLYLGITAGTKMGHWNLADFCDFCDFGENFPKKKDGEQKIHPDKMRNRDSLRN